MDNKIGEKLMLDLAKLLQEGKGQEAMDFILSHREELYHYDAEKTLRANFELRFMLHQFDEAYEDYEYYSSLPYVSQAVEEVLRGIPKLIRGNELASHSGEHFDEEEAHAALTDGEDPYAILGVLQSLKSRDITPYLEEIYAILSSDIHEDVKTFALFLLVDKKIDHDCLLIKRNKSYKINPIKLGNPFNNESYLKVYQATQKEKDASRSGVALELLDQLTLSLYPEKVYKEEEFELFYRCLLLLADVYLGLALPEGLSEAELATIDAMKKALSTPSLLH